MPCSPLASWKQSSGLLRRAKFNPLNQSPHKIWFPLTTYSFFIFRFRNLWKFFSWMCLWHSFWTCSRVLTVQILVALYCSSESFKLCDWSRCIIMVKAIHGVFFGSFQKQIFWRMFVWKHKSIKKPNTQKIIQKTPKTTTTAKKKIVILLLQRKENSSFAFSTSRQCIWEENLFRS